MRFFYSLLLVCFACFSIGQMPRELYRHNFHLPAKKSFYMSQGGMAQFRHLEDGRGQLAGFNRESMGTVVEFQMLGGLYPNLEVQGVLTNTYTTPTSYIIYGKTNFPSAEHSSVFMISRNLNGTYLEKVYHFSDPNAAQGDSFYDITVGYGSSVYASIKSHKNGTIYNQLIHMNATTDEQYFMHEHENPPVFWRGGAIFNQHFIYAKRFKRINKYAFVHDDFEPDFDEIIKVMQGQSWMFFGKKNGQYRLKRYRYDGVLLSDNPMPVAPAPFEGSDYRVYQPDAGTLDITICGARLGLSGPSIVRLSTTGEVLWQNGAMSSVARWHATSNNLHALEGTNGATWYLRTEDDGVEWMMPTSMKIETGSGMSAYSVSNDSTASHDIFGTLEGEEYGDVHDGQAVLYQGHPVVINAANGVSQNDIYAPTRYPVLRNPVQGLTLNQDGSFVYNPPTNNSSAFYFYYGASKAVAAPRVMVSIYFKGIDVTKLELSTTTMKAGQKITGRAFLEYMAPPNGLLLTLSSDSDRVIIPANLNVPSTRTSAPFLIEALPVSTPTQVTISANNSGSKKSATVTILPPALVALEANPQQTTTGGWVLGTVRLDSVPQGQAVVTLQSQTTVIQVPPSVTVQNGANATFQITTLPINTTYVRTISATYAGVTKTVAITLKPACVLLGITANPTTIKGGLSTVCTVTLDKPAPKGGVLVQLIPYSSVLKPPASVTVTEGQTTKSFVVGTLAVGATYTRQLGARYNNIERKCNITVTP